MTLVQHFKPFPIDNVNTHVYGLHTHSPFWHPQMWSGRPFGASFGSFDELGEDREAPAQAGVFRWRGARVWRAVFFGVGTPVLGC